MARPCPQAACVVAATALAALAACAQRQVAHPGDPGARAAEIPIEDVEGAIDPADGRVRPSVAAGWRPVPPPPDYRRRADRETSPPPIRYFVPAEPLLTLGTGGDLADLLHRMVGTRPEQNTSHAFALKALGALGLALDPGLAASEDGLALRALARERGALDRPGPTSTPPHLGDLLLFERVTSGPAVMVAIVVGRDARGVLEFIYLSRGVVRRGFLSRAHPTDKRDADGRILNTFLRHSDGDIPSGAPALAGQLDAGTIRLDRLLR